MFCLLHFLFCIEIDGIDKIKTINKDVDITCIFKDFEDHR